MTASKLIRTVLFSLVLGAGALSMACNTMEGVGKDTEKAGEEIKDTARDVKD